MNEIRETEIELIPLFSVFKVKCRPIISAVTIRTAVFLAECGKLKSVSVTKISLVQCLTQSAFTDAGHY